MRDRTKESLERLFARYPKLQPCRADIFAGTEALCGVFRGRGKLLVCGNGGSAADAEHIVGELMKGFMKKRPLDGALQRRIEEMFPEDGEYISRNLQGALPAISLVNSVALGTAFANDQAPDLSMAQQVLGLGGKGDALLAISTSGNSKNVIYATKAAKAAGLTTMALTGRGGGLLGKFADITIAVPEDETFKVQELHLPVYHALCAALEEEFFDK